MKYAGWSVVFSDDFNVQLGYAEHRGSTTLAPRPALAPRSWRVQQRARAAAARSAVARRLLVLGMRR
jgi:hypothetical protein